jgi:hypothetical protein
MKVILRPLLFSILLLVTSAARAAVPACEDLLLKPIHIEAFTLLPASVMRNNTVVVTDRALPAPYGGHLRVVERVGPVWHSSASATDKTGADIVGDPRWPATFLGPDLACAFGFCQLSKREVTIPDAEALNGFIEHANTKLQSQGLAPITIRYTEVNETQPLLSESYINLFLNDHMPLEKTGPLAVHDISFHIAIMLLPEQALRSYQTKVRLALEYMNFLREHNRFGQWTDDHLKEMMENLVARIDQMGNLTPACTWCARSKLFQGLSYINHRLNGHDPFAKILLSLGLEETPRDYLYMLPASEEFLVEEFFKKSRKGGGDFTQYDGTVIPENSKTDLESLDRLGAYIRRTYKSRMQDLQILLEKP